MFTALTSPSRPVDHGTNENALEQPTRGSWRTDEQPSAKGSWRTDRPPAAPASSQDGPRRPARAQPVDGYEPTKAFMPLDPFRGLVAEPSARGKEPSRVMYQGVSCDLSTEAGRDSLEDLLDADGVDYDKVTNEVRAGGKRYDLDTEMGRRAFLTDGRDGLVDGKWGDSARNVVYDGKGYDTTSERGREALEKAIEGYGVEYDRVSNQVKVGGKSYDLDTREGRAALKNDLGDGVLDGKMAPEARQRLGDILAEQMPRLPGMIRAALEDDLCAGRRPALRA